MGRKKGEQWHAPMGMPEESQMAGADNGGYRQYMPWVQKEGGEEHGNMLFPNERVVGYEPKTYDIVIDEIAGAETHMHYMKGSKVDADALARNIKQAFEVMHKRIGGVNGGERPWELGKFHLGFTREGQPIFDVGRKRPNVNVAPLAVANKPKGKKPAEPSARSYKMAADTLGVPIAAIRAVYKTETGGNEYYANGKLKILFERHYFHKATGGKYDKSDPELSNAQGGGYGKYSMQYRKFEKAKSLNEEAAYYATSFTGFQIMGANYKQAGDFKSAKEFGDAMLNGTADDHLNSFVTYVKNNPELNNYLKKQNWKGFAAHYNGSGYKKNKYDTKMSDNYNDLKNDPLRGLDK